MMAVCMSTDVIARFCGGPLGTGNYESQYTVEIIIAQYTLYLHQCTRHSPLSPVLNVLNVDSFLPTVLLTTTL